MKETRRKSRVKKNNNLQHTLVDAAQDGGQALVPHLVQRVHPAGVPLVLREEEHLPKKPPHSMSSGGRPQRERKREEVSECMCVCARTCVM